MKSDMSSRSRSRTPEVLRTPPRVLASLSEDLKSGSLSPLKLVGTKRKAEDDENVAMKAGELHTPPTKKLAVAAST